MCDLTKGFKLCSCDGEQLKQEDIGWVLQRLDASKEIAYRIGSVAIHHLDEKEETLRNNIEEQLNTQNCFDFNFQPKQDDRLQIKYSAHQWFAYRYKEGQWQIDTSTSFDGWRSQLEPFKDGKLDEK
ncbi:MAG: hypothetical protein GY810_02100 [Aureispira sp.]|nr:hypothetical protein [Aureispira sp.]